MAYLHRLSCDRIDRTCRPHLELVQHHVTEALIVYDTDVDVSSEFLTGDARVQRLVAIVVVPGRE